MKTVNGDFYNHSLSYASQTLCNICQITLADKVTNLYFTDLDRDLKIGGNIYRSDLGFNASAVQLALGISGQTQSIEFLIVGDGDAAAITRQMIYQGHLDYASVVVSWVDFESPTGGKLDLYSGYVTSVDFGDKTTAVLQVQSVLGQDLNICVDKYSATCRYDFGDSDCGVDVTSTQDGPLLYEVLDVQTFKTGLTETSPDGYYNNGTCAFLTGVLKGIVCEIATNYRDTDGRYIFQLKIPMPQPPEQSMGGGTGAHLLLTAGCDKIVNSGCAYWNNTLRFGGEPFVPQQTIVSSSPPPADPIVATVVTSPASASTPTSTAVATTPRFMFVGPPDAVSS